MAKLRPVNNSLSSDSDRFLAVGSVTQSDRLVVELVQPPDTPAAILIKWPPQPTVTDPAKLTATIAAIVRVLGAAQIELAARRAAGCSTKSTAKRPARPVPAMDSCPWSSATTCGGFGPPSLASA